MDREPLSKQVELADVDDALHTQSLDKPDYYSWAIVERYYSSRAATESKGVKGSSWHDVWAAVLFWCTAAGVVALAGLWGVPFLLNAVAHPHDGSFSGVYKLVLGAVAVSTVLGSIFAAASIAFVMALRGGVIVAGVFAFGTILFGCAIVAAWWHWLACFLLFCVFVGYCLLMWWVWRWMDLAKALVEVACEAVNALPSLYGVVAGFFGVQAVWVIVWFVAAVGVNYRTDFGASIAGMPTVVTEHAGSPVKPVAAYGIFIALLLVLVWGVMNWNSVVGFTVAASVGHWALYPHPSRAVPTVTGSSSGGGATSAAGAAALSPSPVVGSLRRAVGPSFGSLAFGNMIYAFAEALRITATLAREGAATDGNYCLCCMYCIVEGEKQGWLHLLRGKPRAWPPIRVCSPRPCLQSCCGASRTPSSTSTSSSSPPSPCAASRTARVSRRSSARSAGGQRAGCCSSTATGRRWHSWAFRRPLRSSEVVSARWQATSSVASSATCRAPRRATPWLLASSARSSPSQLSPWR